MAWKPLPLPLDQGEIIRSILTGLAARIPGWVPTEGAPEVALAEEIGAQLAELHQAAVASADHAAAGVAAAFGFEPIAGTKAALPDVTLRAQLTPSTADAPFDRAITVPAGFTIAVGQQPFVVPQRITKVARFTQVPDGDFAGYWRGDLAVDFEALEAGDEWNIGAAGDSATIQTVSPQIISATLTAPAAGGTGAETLEAFLSRFTGWLSTLKPGGVRAADLAVYASTLEDVQRALALDRYDPADPATPAERTVTIIPVTPDGADLADFEKARVREALEEIREVGFVFHVIDPRRTPVAVDVRVVPSAAAEPAQVADDVAAAVEAALAPSAWGTTDGDPSTWVERDTLRSLDVAVIVANVDGVAAIDHITLDGGTADVALAGPGALIDATVTVTT